MTTLIKQKGLYDCVLASIAMAKGCETWEELWGEADLAEVDGKGVSDERPWMEKAGFKDNQWKRIYVYEGSGQAIIKKLLWKRRAMIAANSLNTAEHGHMMYWDGEKIFDPSTQRTFEFINSLVINSIIIFDDGVDDGC